MTASHRDDASEAFALRSSLSADFLKCLISRGGRISYHVQHSRKSGLGQGYPACLTTKVTKVRVVVLTLPVICQQPSVGKLTPLA